MMTKVEKSSLSYRPEDDAGMVHLALSNDTGADLPIDSAAEASFLLQLLNGDKPVYYDTANKMLITGIEPEMGDDK